MPEQKTDAGLQSILAALAGGGAPQGNIANTLPLLQGIPAQQAALAGQGADVAALASPNAALAAGLPPQQPQIPIEVLLQILGQLGIPGGGGQAPGLPGAPPQVPGGLPVAPTL